MFESVNKFLHYWYFRYLMVTELYMVEKWERAVINGFFIVLLGILSYFNYTVTLKFTAPLFSFLMTTMVNILPSEVFHNIPLFPGVLWSSS